MAMESADNGSRGRERGEITHWSADMQSAVSAIVCRGKQLLLSAVCLSTAMMHTTAAPPPLRQCTLYKCREQSAQSPSQCSPATRVLCRKHSFALLATEWLRTTRRRTMGGCTSSCVFFNRLRVQSQTNKRERASLCTVKVTQLVELKKIQQSSQSDSAEWEVRPQHHTSAL